VNRSVRFVLASASPARLDTLRRAGVEPEVIVSDVDEDGIIAPSVAELTLELARLKARAVSARVPDALVLGCDSLLEFGGRPLGKPGSADVARERWRTLRGGSGVLHTGHVLIGPAGTTSAGAAVRVDFADVSDEEIETYVGTGEPLQVAGAFTIDGLGGWFIRGIEGDPHTVVGLSLPLLRTMLADLGHSLTDVGYPQLR
jgi:septum formation protein